MDHHCMWIDNCIGQFNFSYYFRFMIVGIVVYGLFTLRFAYELLVAADENKVPDTVGFSLSSINFLRTWLQIFGLWYRDFNLYWYFFDAFVIS